MTYDKKATDALLKKLEAHLIADPGFSTKEILALHEMLNTWRGWQTLRQFAKWAVVTLGLTATMLVSWDTVSAALKSLLK